MALSKNAKPKAPTHHMKRQAGHHRRGKQYGKSYWPYIPMVLVVVIGLVANSFMATYAVLGTSSDYSPATLLSSTNQQRQANGAGALTIDPLLTAAAQTKAQDMAARNYWAHDTPDGEAPWAFITRAGYSYELAGENLAYGFNSAEEAVVGWMNSPGHRANILNAGYQNVGFGIVTVPNYQGKINQTIVVAEYGKPATSVANIRFSVPEPTAATAVSTSAIAGAKDFEPQTTPVSRLQLLGASQPSWTTFAVTLMAFSAVLIFIIRHGLYLRRLLLQGENFISHHPVLDITVVTVATLGFLLTRSSGLIK